MYAPARPPTLVMATSGRDVQNSMLWLDPEEVDTPAADHAGHPPGLSGCAEQFGSRRSAGPTWGFLKWRGYDGKAWFSKTNDKPRRLRP